MISKKEMNEYPLTACGEGVLIHFPFTYHNVFIDKKYQVCYNILGESP